MGMTRNLVVLVASTCLSLVACGDDPASPPPKKATKKGRKAAPAAKAAKKAAAASTYPKVANDDRETLTAKHFVPDPTGVENRDPFRSYVIDQGVTLTSTQPDDSDTVDRTETCVQDKWKGADFALRDLTLVGILLKGTRSYALFRDGSGYGHILRRGHCLGKEKAVVEAIEAGFVRLEVSHPAPPGGKKPPAEKRDIPLHTDEYELPSLGRGSR